MVQVIHHLESARFVEHEIGAIELRGWAYFADGSAAESVIARDTNAELIRGGLTPREDVRRHFNAIAANLTSGFELRIVTSSLEKIVLSLVRQDDGVPVPFLEIEPEQIPGPRPRFPSYAKWAAIFDPTPIRNAQHNLGISFSILLPVFDTPPTFLRECIESVQQQFYTDWTLHIVDDGSSALATRQLLARFESHPQIEIIRSDKNQGIAAASNVALSRAKNQFIVLLDHDDRLRPHALSCFGQAIADNPTIDVLYSDEDKIDEHGRRLVPVLKPAFSPEYLRGVMYIGHALCVRTRLAQEIGGFDPHFDGIQDFEFMLRVSERTQSIQHLPKILYHWRHWSLSSALSGNIKGNMDRKQCEAVALHLSRTGDKRIANALGGHRVRLSAPSEMQKMVEFARVSDGGSLWDTLRSLALRTTQRVLVVISGDCDAIDAQSVADLAALALLSDSGVVAPLLVTRDGHVLASGATSSGSKAVPLHTRLNATMDGYAGTLRCNREVMIALPLCIATRSSIVIDASSAKNWWDFCARLARNGLLNRVCASAHAVVRNEASAFNNEIAEAEFHLGDPYFNPHFDRSSGDFRLRHEPPVTEPRLLL